MQTGERRQISVLFCDLVNSVQAANQLDPEEWFDVVDSYYELTKRIVGKYNGYVADYIGDGVMAYFGYPVTDEEAACNAVRAGLALIDEIPELPSPPGIELQSRIGIATGVVVVKDLQMDATRTKKATIVGETPNLASRLQAIADSNSIVISTTTKNIADGLFDFISLGLCQLKGFDEPQEVFQVKQGKYISSRSQNRAENSNYTLVGREKEVAILKQHWSEAQSGKKQLVLLQGEAGIGKSRLVEIQRSSLLQAGVKQQTWFCGPNTAQSSLQPIAEQLMRYSGFEMTDKPAIRRQKLFELMRIYGVEDSQSQNIVAELLGIHSPDQKSLRELSAEKRKEIRLQTFRQMIENWSSGQPVMIIIEDLHWIDPTTLELLDILLASDHLNHCLILATARPEFTPSWEFVYTKLTINHLTKTEALNLCMSLDQNNLITADIALQIVSRCDGNPLFIEELTKAVKESIEGKGSSTGSDFLGRWRPAPLR